MVIGLFLDSADKYSSKVEFFPKHSMESMTCHAPTFTLLFLAQPQWNGRRRTPKNPSPKDGSGYGISQSDNQYLHWRDVSHGEALAFPPSGRASQRKCCTSCVWCCPITWQLWVGHKKGVPCCACRRNAF